MEEAMQREDILSVFDKVNNAVTALVVAYDKKEPDETRKAPIIDRVTDALVEASAPINATHIMIASLQHFVAELLGKAAQKMPSQLEAEEFLNNVLDGEQSSIFALMNQLFPDSRDPDVERYLKQQCDQLRAHAFAILEGRHV
ncbi:hypothetical protein D3W54_06900 [Komagataeibacter medellinensis]|uniref:DUF2383 domain-containing protein n=1 Tax=Komagataeibacter medellinensis TaxID=1177712 RepID=A0ABQ6VWF7_9PROT|nr:hypothetical protein [Komagataeibacter medellinensis]KAB8123970.1 hypothetical protein D3W54_06900 [Komagataeibacter medellinensis]